MTKPELRKLILALLLFYGVDINDVPINQLYAIRLFEDKILKRMN